MAGQRRSRRLALVDQERNQWARELHDETLQGLAAVRLGLSGALGTGSRGAMHDAVQESIGQLDREISGLRALISELRPPELHQLGPTAAIESLARQVAKSGLDVDVNVELGRDHGPGASRQAPELETAIFRIVQEALTNAVKNGHARRGVVEVLQRETAIVVEVRDDGIGFDCTERAEGFGLRGMRERAELLDGELEIESSPGRGTVVRATLPVQCPASPS
jgi:signal transduction histidine kinase